MNKFFLGIALALVSASSYAQVSAKLQSKIDADARQLESKVIEWRRHFHQFPELSNREFNTGAKIASYLKSFGLEVQYPVAKTGVVAILKGAKPGPVVALRADMDALPVTERSTLELRVERKNRLRRKRDRCNACLRSRWSYGYPFGSRGTTFKV